MNGVSGLFVCDTKIMVTVFDAITTDPFDVFLTLNEENSLLTAAKHTDNIPNI